MQLGILGPLLICHEGRTIELPAARHRAVLAVLLVNANRVVPVDELSEVVWDDSPPPGARVTARGYIRRLRLLLGPEVGSRIATRPHGYIAEFNAGELDLLRFAECCRDGGAALRARSWRRCSDTLGEALGLWRDAPLSDVPCDRLQREEVPRLDEMRLQAAEWRAEAELHLGHHDSLVPELQHLVAQQPLRERFYAQLMIALTRCGRQAEALACYHQARRILIDELGVEPGTELRRLHQEILQQNPDLPGFSAAPRASLRPGSHRPHLSSLKIVGGEPGPDARPMHPNRIWSLRDRRPAGEQAPAIEQPDREPGLERSSWPVFQLPAAPADFTGRAAECGRLMTVITPGPGQPGMPLAVVSGPPGVGKSSLALHVAHMVRERFEDGQLWVHLAGTSERPRDPGEVLGEFLRALGAPGSQSPPDLAGRAAWYRSRLAGRRVLVVADDAASAAQVRPLLPGTAGCAMVVTSRARLEGLDGAHLLPLEVMSAEDAVGLLARIVGEGRVAAERSAAGSLAQACGALPLALRITGAKLATRPSWPLSVMVRKITGAQDRLRELESEDLSVRASIASSYESLPESPRRALRLLALLGPADIAEWVIGALLGQPDADEVISELTGQSLLTPVGADPAGEPRYRLHDLLREFAAERLTDEPAASTDTALRSALEGWLQLAQLADARLPPEPYFPPSAPQPRPDVVLPTTAQRLTSNPIAWFTAERVNLLAAVEQACEAGWLDLARQLASRQCAFQHYQDRYDDAERQWRVIADHAAHSDDLAAAYARLRVGASMVRRGQAADALPILDQCIAAHDHNGQLDDLASALYWRSICAVDLDDPERARSAATRGIEVAQRAGARLSECMNLNSLGLALALLGEEEPAVETSESALAMASDLGASYELDSLNNLAYTYVLTHCYESAVTACLRGIEMSRTLGDICGEALSRGLLGDAYQGLGKYHEAAVSLHRALPVFRDHSARHFQAICLLKLGYAYQAMGAPEATRYLEESLQIFRHLRLTRGIGRAQGALDRSQRRATG